MPSTVPSDEPSLVPSTVPSDEPSLVPSTTPSVQPSLSSVPSDEPSVEPSTSPSSSSKPSLTPSQAPSTKPSMSPSTAPSAFPSMEPSVSQQPSVEPSTSPSVQPSLSSVPSDEPSVEPSTSPSSSSKPSLTPSQAPSTKPSMSPSTAPSAFPSTEPSVSQQPSIFACNAHEENVCGYVMDTVNSTVPGYYAACIYDTDKGKYSSKCLRDGEVRDGDDINNKGDVVADCGCCGVGEPFPVHNDEDAKFCANLNPSTTSAPKDCLLDLEYVCNTDIDDEVRVQYCVYDNEKKEFKTKCGNPFNFDSRDGKYVFESCGACD